MGKAAIVLTITVGIRFRMQDRFGHNELEVLP